MSLNLNWDTMSLNSNKKGNLIMNGANSGNKRFDNGDDDDEDDGWDFKIVQLKEEVIYESYNFVS